VQIYLVGGAVRDKLLELPVTEQDWVVVGAAPQDMLAQKYKPVGRDFPVFIHPETGEEYALARTERKTGPGYHGFAFNTSPGVTLEQDLQRRDLTINAMAMDDTGRLIDPWGGQADLKARLLRHVSPAFAEDPLRVLRVARFAARFAHLGFKVAPETLELMREMAASGELDALTPERVWTELSKALSQRMPSRFFKVLRDCGALQPLFPEIDCQFGIPQSPRWHPEIDTGAHLLQALDQAASLSDETIVRFAVLVHDMGKCRTPRDQWPDHTGHEQEGTRVIETFCRRLKVPNDYRNLGQLVALYHGPCHRAFDLPPEEIVKLLEQTDALRRPLRFEQFLIACEADARGRKGKKNRDYPQAPYLRKALKETIKIKVQELSDNGLSGKALGGEIRKRRIEAVRRITPKVFD
jgi:tRNA nucleotidyltransferase (CCA-adding enzyme)